MNNRISMFDFSLIEDITGISAVLTGSIAEAGAHLSAIAGTNARSIGRDGVRIELSAAAASLRRDIASVERDLAYMRGAYTDTEVDVGSLSLDVALTDAREWVARLDGLAIAIKAQPDAEAADQLVRIGNLMMVRDHAAQVLRHLGSLGCRLISPEKH